MYQWALQPSGKVTPRRTVHPLNVAEKYSKIETKKQKLFLNILYNEIGTSQKPATSDEPSIRKTNVIPYEDDEDSSDTNFDVTSNKTNSNQ